MPEVLSTGLTIDDIPMLSSAQLADKIIIRRQIDGVPRDRVIPLSLLLALFTEGAPAALDTWLEVVDRLEDDESALAALNAALANRLRFDAAQSLTEAQRLQGQVNLGLFSTVADYVQGLVLSNNAGDANNRIDIGPGQAKGQGVIVAQGGSITKRLDSTWAVGSGNGGLDTGTKAPSSTYFAHAIRNNLTGVLDVLLSLSVAAPTVPSGWTRVQRLGAILTDGSGNIRPFVQTWNDFFFATIQSSLPNDLSTTSNRAKALLTCALPTGIRVRGHFQPSLGTSNGDSGTNLFLADGLNANSEKQVILYHSGGVKSSGQPVEQYTNTSGQIFVGLSLTGTSVAANTLKTLGWTDYQIPRVA